ncbi:MAG: hypothetical protein L0215_07825 [Gemmataceae bacterium]|nr:hypothetical protein [Gemmataceae bacterium]
MRKLRFFPLVGLLFLPGCFPIELDVNSKGEVIVFRQEGFFLFHPASGQAKPIAGPAGGMPVFARFSPNGKDALLVVRAVRGRDDFRFDLTPLEGGDPRTVFRATQTAHVQFSPDGTQLTIIRIADKQHPEFKKPSTELHLVTVKDSTSRILIKDIALSFRWFADSKRLLLFTVRDVDKQDRLLGEVVEFDISTGQSKPLASVVGSQQLFLDLAPDNERFLITADAVAPPGEAARPAEGFGFRKLFEVNVANSKVRAVGKDAFLARYSPSGKRILFTAPRQDFSANSVELIIANDAWTDFTPLAHDAAESLGAFGYPIPGWLDEESVFYLSERLAYGAGGKSLCFLTVRTDGTNKKNLQPFLDKEAYAWAGKLPDQAPPDDPNAPWRLQPGNVPPDADFGIDDFPPHADRSYVGVFVGAALVLALLILGIVLYFAFFRKPEATGFSDGQGNDRP